MADIFSFHPHIIIRHQYRHEYREQQDEGHAEQQILAEVAAMIDSPDQILSQICCKYTINKRISKA